MFPQILRDTPGVEMYVYPHRERAMPRAEIAEQLRNGCDGLLCLLTDKIDREMVLGYDILFFALMQAHGIKIHSARLKFPTAAKLRRQQL
jgi:hypothetical protein